jgi:hypothetical protein
VGSEPLGGASDTMVQQDLLSYRFVEYAGTLFAGYRI